MTYDIDVFGVAKLYRTSPYGVGGDQKGWEYYSTEWSKQHLGRLPLNEALFIGDDSWLHFRNVTGAFITIYGDGRIGLESTETTSSLHLSIYDDRNFLAGIFNALSVNRGRRWSPNVEFTVYFKKLSHAPNQPGLRGSCLELHLTSDHHFGTTACPYNAHEYILNIMNNGSVYFTGEPYHGTRRDAKPNGADGVNFWTNTNIVEGEQEEGIPMNKDIGIKVIKRVATNGSSVLLEVYKDMTGGYKGGQWDKILEYHHTKGSWENEEMQLLFEQSILNNSDCVIIPTTIDMPHYHDGGMCYLRMSMVKEIELKWLSCRDIDPGSIVPLTTAEELAESQGVEEYESA